MGFALQKRYWKDSGRALVSGLHICLPGLVLLFSLAHSLAADATPLIIAEKNRVVANKETSLILVLDLKPNLKELAEAGARAPDIIETTAASYAKEYLTRNEFNTVPKVVVYLISVENMDEYNRANFDGMKRFGTITFERKNGNISITENKLVFTP